MDKQEIIDALVARGVYVIPDDEVTDMGEYVVWNKPTADRQMLTCSAEHVIDALRPTVTPTEYAIYPTKPTRLVGLFRQSGTGRFIRMSVVSQHEQLSTDVGDYNTEPRRYFTPHVVPAPYRELSRGERNALMGAIARNCYRRDVLTSEKYNRHVSFISAVTHPIDGPSLSLAWRGCSLSVSRFNQISKQLKEIGQMVAHADDHDADDIIRAIEYPNGYSTGIADGAIEAWNDRCDPGDEITRADCGHLCSQDDTHDTHDGAVCSDCFEDNYVWVENTEDYRQRGDVYEHSDDCYYTYPEEEDEDDESDDDSQSEHVRNYSTNVLRYLSADPTIKPSSYGEFLMGVELEVMPQRGYHHETADRTARTLCPNYAILKSDGSLGDSGFEIVTAPRGLKEHIERLSAWKPHEELRAWDAECCGLHVHISSQAFTQATLGKFIEFINAKDNDSFIKSIAGRHPATDSQSREYCQREGRVVEANPKATLDGKSTSRYFMVNTTNLIEAEATRLGLSESHCTGHEFNTIELRIFRASLKKSRMLAQVEFAHAAVMFCRWSSMRELRQRHFINWLRGMAGVYPHLAKWYGVKANTKSVNPSPKVRAEAEV